MLHFASHVIVQKQQMYRGSHVLETILRFFDRYMLPLVMEEE